MFYKKFINIGKEKNERLQYIIYVKGKSRL